MEYSALLAVVIRAAGDWTIESEEKDAPWGAGPVTVGRTRLGYAGNYPEGSAHMACLWLADNDVGAES